MDNIYSVNKSPEVTTHYPWPDGPGKVSEASAKKLKHGYYASVSYIDAQIGIVMEELDRLDLAKNTIVVLWSDHGWHLGEHTMFGKMSNFEIATRSPLIMRIPDLNNSNHKMDQLVESIDVYPTLAELCGFDYPDNLDGESMVELLKIPAKVGPEYARSFYYRNGALGKSIRTDRYRIVRWASELDSTMAVELYDHQIDPKENVNIADKQPGVRDSLLGQLSTVRFMSEKMPFQKGWE